MLESQRRLEPHPARADDYRGCARRGGLGNTLRVRQSAQNMGAGAG